MNNELKQCAYDKDIKCCMDMVCDGCEKREEYLDNLSNEERRVLTDLF